MTSPLAVLDRAANDADRARVAGRGYCSSIPPAVYGPIRAVVVATEWVPTVHAMIDAGGLDVHRGTMVSRRYLHRLVNELAGHADARTGRNCMAGHHALGAALARVRRTQTVRVPNESERRSRERAAADDAARHVHTAVKVLTAAGVVVCVEQGHLLTGVERLQEHANHSTRRVARSVYALTLPRAERVDRTVLDTPTGLTRRSRPGRPVDNRPPARPAASPTFRSPRGGKAGTGFSGSALGFSSFDVEKFRSTPDCGRPGATTTRLPAANPEKDAAPRRPAPNRRRNWEPDPGLYDLALAVRQALPVQLGYERPLKLCATLQRFWRLGWDADSLVTDLRDAYARLGRRFPTHRPNEPARWLGWALKHLDQTATPPLRRYDAHAAAADAEICPHGVEGGARLRMIHGNEFCPLCRRGLPVR